MSLRTIGLFFLGVLGGTTSVQASVLPPSEKQHIEEFKERLLARSRTKLLTNWMEENESPDPHIIFQSQVEAIQWVKSSASWIAASFGAKTFQVLDRDKRSEILQSYIHELWSAYVDLYPDQTAGLNEPTVVLVQSEIVNAFVPTEPESHKVAHVVVVLTGFLNKSGGVENRDPISGTLAHELAHSIFRHGLSKYAAKINKFYFKSEAAFGYLAIRNSVLDERMRTWISGAESAGDLIHHQLLDLPSAGVGNPIGMRLFNQMKADFFNSGTECMLATSKYKEWVDFFRFSSLSSEIFIEQENLPSLQSASQQLIDSLRGCFSNQRKPFLQLISEATGIPQEVFAKDAEFNAVAKKFDQAPDLTSALRDFIHLARTKMEDIQKDIDLSQIDYYTYEENADDHSAIVHAYLGKNPMSLAKFFELLLDVDSQACREILNRGETPITGSFSDPHRATCYRIFHLAELSRRIPKEGSLIEEFAKDYSLKSNDSD